MDAIISDLMLKTDYLPYIIFGALILSGLNFPFSEDIIIISSALVADANPRLLIPLYISIYSGVLISDHIAYWIGYRMSHGVKKSSFFSRMISEKKIEVIQKYLHSHGILTFIICRFIPFGVRNALFMSSGLSRMNYKYFTLYDTIAVSINTASLYFLIYFLGISVKKPFKIAGYILFTILIITAGIIIFKLLILLRDKRKQNQDSDL